MSKKAACSVARCVAFTGLGRERQVQVLANPVDWSPAGLRPGGQRLKGQGRLERGSRLVRDRGSRVRLVAERLRWLGVEYPARLEMDLLVWVMLALFRLQDQLPLLRAVHRRSG